MVLILFVWAISGLPISYTLILSAMQYDFLIILNSFLDMVIILLFLKSSPIFLMIFTCLSSEWLYSKTIGKLLVLLQVIPFLG